MSTHHRKTEETYWLDKTTTGRVVKVNRNIKHLDCNFSNERYFEENLYFRIKMCKNYESINQESINN